MFFFFKQKTAYEMRISDWSSDVCSSDLPDRRRRDRRRQGCRRGPQGPGPRLCRQGEGSGGRRRLTLSRAPKGARLYVALPQQVPEKTPQRLWLKSGDRKSKRLKSSN